MSRWSRSRPKWDETDFEFQIEDFTPTPPPEYQVLGNRVYTVPAQRKKFGSAQVPMDVCIHGRPGMVECPTCEFEAPKVASSLPVRKPS